MDFDQLLTDHVGEFGCGQLVVLLAASSGFASLATTVLSMVFVTQTPAWSCTSASDALCQRQLLLQQQKHDLAAVCSLQAAQYRWDRPQSSLISTFGLVCPDRWKIGWANAVFFIGYTVGSTFFGWLADAHGRKTSLLASSASTAIFTLLSAASPSYAWYIAGRSLQGLCGAGMPTAAYILATESVGPTYRGRAGVAAQLTYHVGELLLPLMAFVLQDWRLLYVASGACCLVTTVLVAAVPESPRWQLLQGRTAAAGRTLAWLTQQNGREKVPPAVLLGLRQAMQQQQQQRQGNADGRYYKEQENCPAGPTAACASKVSLAGASLEAGADAVSGGGQAGACQVHDNEQQLQQQDSEAAAMLLLLPGVDSAAAGKTDRVVDAHGPHNRHHVHTGRVARGDSIWLIFSDPLLARLFWVSAWLCTVMATTFFTASLATEKLQGSLYVSFVVTSIGALPAIVIGAVAVDVVGRRLTITTGLLITGLACSACALLGPGGWSTALASLGRSGCASAWSLAYLYAAELMPTSVRSAALAGGNQAARLGGAAAPFFVYAGEQLHHPKLPFALVGGLATLTAFMAVLLPETLGMRQPDTVADLHQMYGGSGGSSNTCSRSKAMVQLSLVARGGGGSRGRASPQERRGESESEGLLLLEEGRCGGQLAHGGTSSAASLLTGVSLYIQQRQQQQPQRHIDHGRPDCTRLAQ